MKIAECIGMGLSIALFFIGIAFIIAVCRQLRIAMSIETQLGLEEADKLKERLEKLTEYERSSELLKLINEKSLPMMLRNLRDKATINAIFATMCLAFGSLIVTWISLLF